MKTVSPFNLLKQQNGVTLIEMLVSITIGLVFMIAIGFAYMNSTNAARQRENQSELNEPTSVVMRMLRHDVSLAGYVDVFDMDATASNGRHPQAASVLVPGNETLTNLYRRAPMPTPIGTPLTQFFPGLMPIFGCDGAMNSTPFAISTTATATVLTCGANSTTSQTLQIAYQAAPSATTTAIASLGTPNGNTGEGRDCNEQGLTAPITGGREAKFAINRYFINVSSDGVNELYCSGSGNVIAQPIARGVEEFVIRYQTANPGLSTSLTAAGSAQSQYASAATVSASALGWANVTAVEICMISATSGNSGAAATGTTQLQPTRPTCVRDSSGNFNANITRTAGDTRLWKRFISVVSVRNAIFSTPY